MHLLRFAQNKSDAPFGPSCAHCYLGACVYGHCRVVVRCKLVFLRIGRVKGDDLFLIMIYKRSGRTARRQKYNNMEGRTFWLCVCMHAVQARQPGGKCNLIPLTCVLYSEGGVCVWMECVPHLSCTCTAPAQL